MSKGRRVTLRTAWVDDEESGQEKKGKGRGSVSGPKCPSCGVPLKRTSSGKIFCWFCEREFDIEPTQFEESTDVEQDREPEIGTRVTEAEKNKGIGIEDDQDIDIEMDVEEEEFEIRSEEEFEIEEDDDNSIVAEEEEGELEEEEGFDIEEDEEEVDIDLFEEEDEE
ncbi:MAG: hypothetical protein R6V01_09720, partial [Thermoplasmatota archaeon]